MDAPEPSRRPWQSHEWNVLLAIAIVTALPLGWLAWQAGIVQHRRFMRTQIEAAGGLVIGSEGAGGGFPGTIVQIRAGDPEYRVSEIRRLLGDDAIELIVLGPGIASFEGEEIKAFPEAHVVKFSASPPP
jgi:hypothetical protein